jgi:hypothetical protein
VKPTGGGSDDPGQPLSIGVSGNFDPGYTGSILASSISDPGTGYVPADTINLLEGGTAAGGTPAVVVVDTVDGGGAVLTYHLSNTGTWYREATVYQADGTSGVGTDFVLQVDSITPLTDATAKLTVLYWLYTVAS